MNRKAGWAVTAALVAAGVAYQVLIYHAAHGALPVWLRLTLKSLPLLLLAWWAWTRSRRRAAWLALIAGAGVLIWWMDSRSFGTAAYGVPHALVYVSLGWLFGHTLARGRVPLVTSMATRVHGPLTPAMQAYTRHVTIAWTLFCAGQVSLSALLYQYASLDTWSLFITVLNLPLLGLMFVADYATRMILHSDHPQASIAQAIRAFSDHTRAQSEAARKPLEGQPQ